MVDAGGLPCHHGKSKNKGPFYAWRMLAPESERRYYIAGDAVGRKMAMSLAVFDQEAKGVLQAPPPPLARLEHAEEMV